MKTKILAGLLVAAALAIAPGVAFARGGGGGGGGSHGGGGGGSHGGGSFHSGGFHDGGGFHGSGFHDGGGFRGGGFHDGGRFHGGGGFHDGGRFHGGGGFHDGSFHARGDFHGNFTHHGFVTDRGRFRHDHDRFFSHGFAFGVPWPGYYDPYYAYDYRYHNYTAPYSSDVILAVQRTLAQLGYYHGPVDGVVGPQTERAIRWFQSADSLPVTGEIDSATLRALRIG
jgi:Putative peptidoglycan binding domain